MVFVANNNWEGEGSFGDLTPANEKQLVQPTNQEYETKWKKIDTDDSR